MPELPSKLLVVEDDPSLRRSLRTTLTFQGFETVEARNGEEALVTLRSTNFEAVLLDINMPGIGGVETCRRIRRNFTRLPVLMLTVRDEEDDKVEALEAGADDYVTKPFRIRELTARIRTAIRRYRAPETPAETILVVGEIVLDPSLRQVERKGRAVHLTPHEFDALHYLMAHAGRPVTHTRLLGAIRGRSSGDDRGYLRVLIGHLRKKLEDDAASPEYLLTESFIGYRFRESEV